MAVSSLNRMTVPIAAAGDGTASTQGLLMPKLQYRFRVALNGFGVGSVATELTKQVIDVQRPTVNFPEISIPIYNSTLYLAGKAAWNAISLNVRDDATGEVAKLVGQQVQKQMDFSEQASAASGIDYKFQMSIQILDGGNGINTPNILETWELYGCYLADINYQTLSYNSSEPVTIGMSIRYDNAVQTPTAGGIQVGVGQFIGRTLGTNITGVGAPQT